jgi:hypothetical protein
MIEKLHQINAEIDSPLEVSMKMVDKINEIIGATNNLLIAHPKLEERVKFRTEAEKEFNVNTPNN